MFLFSYLWTVIRCRILMSVHSDHYAKLEPPVAATRIFAVVTTKVVRRAWLEIAVTCIAWSRGHILDKGKRRIVRHKPV